MKITYFEKDGQQHRKITFDDSDSTVESVISPNMSRTIRLNDNTVADVLYQYDKTVHDYVEKSRIERAEPSTPLKSTDQQIDDLKKQLADTNAKLAAVLDQLVQRPIK